MNLSDITERFVQERRDALERRWGARNERMNDYEKLYLLDMWESQAEPDERRIALPIAWTRVEAFRPLFLAQHPVISVPLSHIQAVEQRRADKIEKYLYGVWYEANVLQAADLAEWSACCLGEGVFRCLYTDEMADDELPLLITALDPREVYATPGTRPGRDREVVHYMQRRRRDIEAEWGHTLKEGGRPTNAEELELWLDGDVDYIDYWREELVEVEEEIAPEPEEELGPLAKAMDWARRQMEDVFGTERPAEPEGPATRNVKRRQIINCVLADEEFVKKPVVMPGYNRIPFIRYPGISTLLPDQDGALSVLFPITAGSHKPGTVGVAAAMSELATFKQRIIELYAAGAFVTDDNSLTSVDTKPGALNYIARDTKLNWLAPPGPHPTIDQQMALLDQQLEDATVSRAMMGQVGREMSALAISAMNNPVMMRVASRQLLRERAYQDLNELILSLTEQYAPPDGWHVSGPNQDGMDTEVQLRPDEIGGYYRNRVQLTASLPKDEAGEIMVLSQLVDKRQLSRETFLDALQKIKRMPTQSPMDEMKRILRDTMLFEGPTAQALAQLVLSDYDAELAAALQPQPAPQPQTPGGPAGPAGQGPMEGLPTSVLPPGAVPPQVGLESMMGMEGTPMPGPPEIPGGRPRRQ